MGDLSTFVFEAAEPPLPVRVLVKAGEPWFIAKDICKAIGIANWRDATAPLDDDEKGVGLTDTLGGNQEMLIVSESGLYTIMLRSRQATTPGTLPHRFRRWVTSEVLPSVRKAGQYGRTAERQARAEREELRDKLRAVQIATGLRGHAAGAHVWHELGLPPLPEGQPAPTGGKRPRSPITDAPFDLPDEDARATAVRQFVVDRLEPHVGGSIPTTEVYLAYRAWAAEHGAEPLTSNAFGVVTTHLRLPKGRRGSARSYRNLRFRPRTPETLQ